MASHNARSVAQEEFGNEDSCVERLVTREEFKNNTLHLGMDMKTFELSDMVDNTFTISSAFRGKNVVSATIHFRSKTIGSVDIVNEAYIATHFADVTFTIDNILRGSIVPGHSFLCEKAWYPFSVTGFCDPTLRLIFEKTEEVRHVKDMMIVELVINTAVFATTFVSTVLQKQFDVEWFNGERIRFVAGFYGYRKNESFGTKFRIGSLKGFHVRDNVQSARDELGKGYDLVTYDDVRHFERLRDVETRSFYGIRFHLKCFHGVSEIVIEFPNEVSDSEIDSISFNANIIDSNGSTPTSLSFHRISPTTIRIDDVFPRCHLANIVNDPKSNTYFGIDVPIGGAVSKMMSHAKIKMKCVVYANKLRAKVEAERGDSVFYRFK
jgi:hypothetical protein